MKKERFNAIHPDKNKKQVCIIDKDSVKFADGKKVELNKVKQLKKV